MFVKERTTATFVVELIKLAIVNCSLTNNIIAIFDPQVNLIEAVQRILLKMTC